MGLFDIAIKNIKRNFYNYFLYFVSMTFSIMIYFTFTSIQFNTQVQEIVGSSLKIATGFKTASIVIAIFAAMFIWFSNSFFTKKRKKEVALYSLLGIRKRQIARMLFYENIVMGLVALASGILVGSLLSKLFIMLLIKLMGFSANIKFMIPIKAILYTALVFAIIFLVTSIHSYTLIYRFKLIELFTAANTREKEPKASAILSILSISLIGYGYWNYIGSKRFSPNTIFITLALTVVGTYALFSSLTLFIIKLSKKNTARYYSGINMIGTSQLLYRIKGSARTLATIAVLSATTLTAIEATSSLYYRFYTKISEDYAFTYAYASKDKQLDSKVEAVISKYPKNKLISSVNMNFLQVDGEWPNIYKKSFDKPINPIKNFYIISESSYNEIAKAKGIQDKLILSDESQAVVFDEGYNTAMMESYIGKTITINQENKKTDLRIVDFKVSPIANERMIDGAAVVKDVVYERYFKADNIYRIKGYVTENRKDSEELTKELSKIVPQDSQQWPRTFTSFYDSYRDQLSGYGSIIFIGAFLGLVFLVATGSIIFFKQLSEANDDIGRYKILKNIGVTNREIKASISKQIFTVFALPLVVGIVHSLVASTLVSKLLYTDFTVPILLTIGTYTLIYMIYYFLTVSSYYNIVNSNN